MTEAGSRSEEPRRGFRWQALLQGSADALFVLDRRRRLLFVNAAFETLAALTLEQVRGLLCRRPRPPGGDALPEDVVAHVLTPPAEVLQGTSARLRRLYHDRGAKGAPSPPVWWDVEFLPFRQEDGFFVVGRIVPVASAAPAPPGAPEVLPERLVSLRRRAAERYGFGLLESRCPAMARLGRQVRLALQVRGPVLLVGEAGSGKTALARLIHHQGSDAESAFAALDCERLPADAVTALLAGESPALAAVGTVYLRQPSALPREMQTFLCQRLSTGDERPRVLAGLCSPVADLLREGKLLEELAGLLSPLTLEVPPLRQRLDDLPRLAEGMLARMEGGPFTLTPAAMEMLRGYGWPGNLGELFTVLDDSRSRASQGRIDVADLPAKLRLNERLSREAGRAAAPAPLSELLAQVERRLIEVALRRARGNRSKAAEALGLSRSQLQRRMKALGMEEEGE